MKTAIIGGGASGMIAAIVSAGYGDEVTVFEHMQRMGKKLLLTGSGKCNISNTDTDLRHYHGGDMSVITSVLSACTPEMTRSFFEKLGLFMKDRNGYLYPYSEQASAVLDVLRFSIRDMGIDVSTETDVKSIRKEPSGEFTINTSQGRFIFDKIIMCTGSCAARNTGSDGSGYKLAASLGHTVIKPLPALTSLTCEEGFFPSIAGIRTKANVSIYASSVNSGDMEMLGSETGELQLTKAGISGIPVFNLSYLAIRAMDNGQKVKGVIDLLPDVNKEDMNDFIRKRTGDNPERCAEELLIGILAKPLGICICKRCGIDLKEKCSLLTDKEIGRIASMIKEFDAEVNGYGAFENSQVVQGGVSLKEVKENLESRLVPGVYFAGELLDVNGDCGGYNLQWAASSATVAACGGR